MAEIEEQIPSWVRSTRFEKRLAHCSDCDKCHYDLFFLGYFCPVKKKTVWLSEVACKEFHSILANFNPDWQDHFIYGDMNR